MQLNSLCTALRASAAVVFQALVRPKEHLTATILYSKMYTACILKDITSHSPL